MRVLRPVSFLFSLCLHAGVIAVVFFLPQQSPPLIDLTSPVIDIGIYTIGKPGQMPVDLPDAPAAPVAPPTTPATPVTPQTPPETPPEAPPPPQDTARPEPVPAKPEPAPLPPPPPPEPVPVKPEPAPVPIAQPDAPKPPETTKPEPPKPEPPKPEPPTKPVAPKPAEPVKPAVPARPSRPAKTPEQILREALGDLSGRNDPDATIPGDGPGGSGGDGIGLLGSYSQSLRSRIQPNWEYQGRADRRNPTALVEIRIASDGTILEAVIVTSSGDPAFDGSALKAVYDTKRVEPPPTPDLMRVQLPFALEGPGRL